MKHKSKIVIGELYKFADKRFEMTFRTMNLDEHDGDPFKAYEKSTIALTPLSIIIPILLHTTTSKIQSKRKDVKMYVVDHGLTHICWVTEESFQNNMVKL